MILESQPPEQAWICAMHDQRRALFQRLMRLDLAADIGPVSSRFRTADYG
jgi:hypothetical protein